MGHRSVVPVPTCPPICGGDGGQQTAGKSVVEIPASPDPIRSVIAGHARQSLQLHQPIICGGDVGPACAGRIWSWPSLPAVPRPNPARYGAGFHHCHREQMRNMEPSALRCGPSSCNPRKYFLCTERLSCSLRQCSSVRCLSGVISPGQSIGSQPLVDRSGTNPADTCGCSCAANLCNNLFQSAHKQTFLNFKYRLTRY